MLKKPQHGHVCGGGGEGGGGLGTHWKPSNTSKTLGRGRVVGSVGGAARVVGSVGGWRGGGVGAENSERLQLCSRIPETSPACITQWLSAAEESRTGRDAS